MPDSQSNVEINLRINATNREAVNQLQNDLNRLKGTVTESTGQYTGFTGAVTGAERATNLFGGQARTASAATTGLGTAASAAKTEVAGLSVALSAVTLGAIAAGAAFAAMGVGLAAAISKGIELQQGLQNLREGVSGVLTTDSANFGGGQAGRAATAAIDQIVISAKAAQIPISDLTKSFDAIFPSAARANTSIAGLSNLLAQLTAQQGALHISQTKMVSDLEAIFNGTVSNSNVLAQNLGITKEQATAWRENGTITDELAQKVQSFGAAHTETSDTIDRAQQKINAAFEQFAVAVAKPLVEPLTNALNAMSAAMNSVDATNVVTQLERIIAVAGSVISAMQNVGKAIANALQSAISFAGSIPLGEGEGSQGGRAVGAGPGFPTGLQAGGSSINEVLQKQLDFEREVGDLTTRGTGTSPLVGGTKGGGGGGGAAGPSQDVLNQQEISKIQSEINEKESAYHTLIEENTVAHKLGQASLGQMQSADAKASQVFIGAIDQSREKLVAMKAAVDATGQAQGGLNDKEQTQINRLQTAIDKLDLLKARTQLFAAGQNFFGGFTQGLQKFSDTLVLTGEKASQVFGQIVNTGIDATASALTGLITGTQNWAQAFIQAGEQIIEILIKVALQAVIGAALQQTVNKGTRFEDARTAAAGAYSSAAQIPYIGWILAPIAGAAAFAAVLAFAQGGIVPGPPSDRDNHLARVASGEGIVTAKAVQYYGPETIHAMNAMTFATGGVVGQFGTPNNAVRTARNISVNNFWDKDEMVQHMITHPDLNHHIVDTIRKNRFLVKV